MDIIKCQMSIEVYKALPDEFKRVIVVTNCEPQEFDYTFSDKWKALKSESIKAYKKLKNLEYDLRNGNN